MTATVKTIACIDCGNDYTVVGRAASRRCPACRTTRKLEQDRARQAVITADRALVRQTADSLREQLDPSHYATVDAYIAELGIALAPTAFVRDDKKPDGWMAHAGPDEGVSTYFNDLADELEAKRGGLSGHEWYEGNPHWMVGAND